MKQARFGSIAWQDGQSRRIINKLHKKEALDDADLAFIQIQMFHDNKKKR